MPTSATRPRKYEKRLTMTAAWAIERPVTLPSMLRRQETLAFVAFF